MRCRKQDMLRGVLACVLGVLFLSAGAARAEIESVELHLFGGMTNLSRWQIKRLLSPYVPSENIHFSQFVDKDGRKNPWRTIVEITPEGQYLDLYDVVHTISDTRGVRDGRRLYRTDVTATGDLRAHFGFTRRSFGWIPGWVQARGLVTSGLWHHLYTEGSGEKFVFHANEQYDALRVAPHHGEGVRIHGRIAGFDGPYPVVVLGEFESLQDGAATESQPETAPDKPTRHMERREPMTP